MSLLPALMAAASAFCALVAGVAAAAALARASRASRAGEAGGAKAHARDLFTAALITVWAALPGLWAVAQPERFDAGRYTRMTRSEQWPLEFGVLITGCNLVAALALAARLRGERRRRGSDQAIASTIEQWERERHRGGGSP